MMERLGCSRRRRAGRWGRGLSRPRVPPCQGSGGTEDSEDVGSRERGARRRTADESANKPSKPPDLIELMSLNALAQQPGEIRSH